MERTYLFAGASSFIAKATARSAKQAQHHTIGISTKSDIEGMDVLHTVDSYDLEKLPAIDQAIDGLVYFPGSINLKPFHRLTADELLIDFKINALGAAQVIQKYLPQLKRGSNPSIVLFSSVAAQQGMTFHASIAMAKAAVEGLTKSLAAEFAPFIRVNCIAPSLMNTPLAERFLNTPEKLEASEKRNPLRKIGQAHEVAEVVLFLLSEQASWITGQILAIDGGMSTLRTG